MPNKAGKLELGLSEQPLTDPVQSLKVGCEPKSQTKSLDNAGNEEVQGTQHKGAQRRTINPSRSFQMVNNLSVHNTQRGNVCPTQRNDECRGIANPMRRSILASTKLCVVGTCQTHGRCDDTHMCCMASQTHGGCDDTQQLSECDGTTQLGAETPETCETSVLNYSRKSSSESKLRSLCDTTPLTCEMSPKLDYEIYVVSEQLKNEVCNALIDTGSQISLVKHDAVKDKRQIIKLNECLVIKGITGNSVEISGKLPLTLQTTLEPLCHEFYVVDKLPHNLDLIIGQDGLRKYNVTLNKGKLEPVYKRIPPLSETVVTFPTSVVGERLIENQILGEGVYVACCLVKCNAKTFQCLCVNVTDTEQIISRKPQLQYVPCKSQWHTVNAIAETGAKYVTKADAEASVNHIAAARMSVKVRADADRDTNADECKVSGANVHTPQGRNRIRKLNDALRLSHIKEGREEIRNICNEYHDIFKLEGDKLTSTKGIQHTIPTPTIPRGKAITLKNYRLPEKHKIEVEKQINDMLDQGIITESQSPWNFPLIVVPKKIDASGKRKWRLCIDFRKLNDKSIGDSYPLPNIQEILDKLGRARYFSALDCASGYWQIPIAKEDQCKTAFSTNTGHYEFTRMPFGLKAAPATFQRLMNNVLSGTLGSRCLVYLDDIVIYGESMKEHNAKLREVFQQLRNYNLKIEPDKCEFLKSELQYLGHIVTADGVKPDPEKTRAVSQFPIPKKAKDVKSFLGLVGYYRKFISEFSKIAIPLTRLLKKDTVWKWEKAEQESFDKLKEMLVQAPILQYPNFQKPFILTTDASNYAVGAILSQGELGKDLPIAYASRTFNNAEINYSVCEKELAAIIWACKHFRPYLLGTKFTIVTDHKALKWIFNVKDPGSRLMRWKLLLEQYDYEIIHKAGKRNVNADALSRYPVTNYCYEVSIENREQIIKEMHECPFGGHQGVNRTVERIKLYTSWPNMVDDVTKFIKACKTCQLNKVTQLPIKQPLIITDIKDTPWEKIYLDIVGPLPLTEQGNKYILTCQDNLSKYLIAIPMSDQTAEETAKAFNTHIVCIFGIPNEIVTDQGTNFMSNLFKDLCKLLKINKLSTTAYHPESNGALERTHRTLIEYIRCFCNPQQTDWDTWLPFACFTFNTTIHTSTKFTPYEVLFGRKANIPGRLQAKPTPLYNYEDLVQEMRYKFQNCHQQVREHLRKQKEKQKEYYDKERSRQRQFKVGDQVLLKIEQRNKLDSLWKGPYEIQEVHDNSNVVLQEVGKRKKQVVHSNRLKPYFVAGIEN